MYISLCIPPLRKVLCVNRLREVTLENHFTNVHSQVLQIIKIKIYPQNEYIVNDHAHT